MSWLLRDNWLGSFLAFVLGAGITWYLLDRRPALSTPPTPQPPAPQQPPATDEPPTVVDPPAAGKTPAVGEPAVVPEPSAATEQPAVAETAAPAETAAAAERGKQAEFSLLMGGEPTLFDHIQPVDEGGADERGDVPPGRYGEGSADAVPHQGPPDGFTIKGNAQSMLFHTPDSPYYGRTKPEVWFRSEADAERAGFTKYARRPRKAADPRG